MRGIKFFGLAIALLGVSSCQDDVIEKTGTPVQTGDEIMFGSDLSSSSVQTRTIYGDPTGWQDVNKRYPTSYPVNWEDGDEIMIFCPQASQPANKRVNYRVTPSTTDASVAARVDKIEDIGLQWGEGIGELGTHRFYGIYPASAVEGTAEETEQGKIHLSIPELQPVFKWVITQNNDGTITYNGIPNTDNAYMYAYAEVNKNDMSTSNAVYLKFKPLTTVLDFIVNGPESTDETINVTNLTVTAQDENTAPILTGNFICNISSGGGETITVEDDGSTGYSRSTISVPLYINAGDNVEVSEGLDPADFKGKPIALKKGDMVRVRTFFLRSNDASVPKNTLQVAVSQVGTAPKRKKLQTADIAATEINMVDLPCMEKGGTNFWMGSIPSNVYASELSIPGSKLSMATETVNGQNFDLYFQGSDIGTQFKDGVRAFNIVVRRDDETAFSTVVEEKGGWSTAAHKVETFKESLGRIRVALDNAINDKSGKGKKEFVFVQLAWCNNGGFLSSDGNEWLRDLSKFIADNASTYGIYTGTFNESTTIEDLAGKIVIKMNVNDPDYGSSMNTDYITSGSPVLFAKWKSAVPVSLPLCWGSWADNSPMRWYASEATAVGSGGDCTWPDKKQYAEDLFKYTLNNHELGVWVMNDLGGYTNRNDNNSSVSGQERVTYLTRSLNNFAVETLQARDANSSLGIIYMNFADMEDGSGVTYQSDWLIQTIIDNNFKFPMKMEGEGEPSTQYNAAYSKGGNAIGWDN